MKMRDLEKLTGVHRETIRTYFRHDLVPEPNRPKPNVADYDQSHIDAIIAVKKLQQGSSLTLKQIKASLEGNLSNKHITASSFQQLEVLLSARMGIDDAPLLISKLEPVMPHAQEDAQKMEKIGLVKIIKTKNGPSLNITDYRIVSIWGEMREAGFTEELGFTPEMLTYYLEAAELVAGQESSLFLERVQGKISEEKAAEMLQLALRSMLHFFGLVRMKLFLNNLKQSQTPIDESETLSLKD